MPMDRGSIPRTSTTQFGFYTGLWCATFFIDGAHPTGQPNTRLA